MRSKRLAVFFVIIIFAGIVAVLNNVVFCVRKIKVLGADEDFGLRVANASLAVDKNILTLDKSVIIDNIARVVPECRVVQLEKVFPDTVIIRSVRRNPSVFIKSNGNYYTLSEDMAVLGIGSKRPDLISIGLTNGEEWGLDGAREGYPLRLDDDGGLAAVTLAVEMLYSVQGFEPTSVRSMVVDRTSSEIRISTSGGVRIIISGYRNAGEKLRLALSMYAAYPAYRNSGTIITYLDASNNLKASYIKG